MSRRAVVSMVLFLAATACTASTDASTTTSEGRPFPSTSPESTDSGLVGRHPPCRTEGGSEEGLQPTPAIQVEDQTIDGTFAFGNRSVCPWLVHESTVTTLIAVDGPGVESVDLEVEAGSQLTVAVTDWGEDITVSRLTWVRPKDAEEQPITRIEAEPGIWRLTAPSKQGVWLLSLGLDWGYGADTWGWRVSVVR